MRKRIVRVLLSALAGLLLLWAAIWVLSVALNEDSPSYQGKTLYDWVRDAKSQDPSISNRALVVLTEKVMPELRQAMFCETNDSAFKLWLVDQLNELPKPVINHHIYCTTAAGRRVWAVTGLGEIGPVAKPAMPDLLKILEGKDLATRPGAALALGQIQSDPDKIVPLLIGLLDDHQDGVPESAVRGLGYFGSHSKSAVPRMIDMLKIPDKEMRAALHASLRQIAPEEAAKAGIK